LSAYRLPLAGLLGLAVAGGLLHAQDTTKPAHNAIRPQARDTMKWWLARHEGFAARAKKGDVDVVFLGDSITHGWEGGGKAVWKKHFEPLKAVNFGIGGDQTGHVLWRITRGKELEGINPKAFVLMIGTNNMGANREGAIRGGDSAAHIAEGIEAIVKELRRQKPDAQVLVLGIFPRAASAEAPARAKIKEVNKQIAKLADGKKILYLDIGARFLDKDGALHKEIMPDYLHLTPRGYEVWAEAIEPTLKKMLAK
jgi:lysophospholipase L1-like esterase